LSKQTPQITVEKLSDAIINQVLTSPNELPTRIPTYQQQQLYENQYTTTSKKENLQGMTKFFIIFVLSGLSLE
jgi:hypothetical protein